MARGAWIPEPAEAQADERSYWIKVEGGISFRRNRIDIRPSNIEISVRYDPQLIDQFTQLHRAIVQTILDGYA